MISASDLKKYGLDPESLQKRFDTDKRGEKEERLVKRWAARAQGGQDFNLCNYRLYLAIDKAWDSGFHQCTQTLISIIKDLVETQNEAAAVSAIQRWNMPFLLGADTDPKTGLPTGKTRVSLPALFSVIISIARAYTLMRVARLVNERMQIPLFKYEPAYMTGANRLKAEIITQRVDLMAREFGYASTISQAIQYAGMYGHQLQFIEEEWFRNHDFANGEQKAGKEGLRNVLPHPSRTYFDVDYPLWTLNNDTGTRYIGYWRVTTWGNVMNGKWWNLDRVKKSYKSNSADWNLYFQTTGQCRMASGCPGGWAMFSQIDRERALEEQCYSRSDDDQPVWITEHFEKINPHHELSEKMPDCDLWFRVVLASDNCPLYVAALPDRPACVWLWEPTDNRSIQPSMMLELLPIQDHASNIVSQGLLSIKQALANVTLFDEDVVDQEAVNRDIGNPNESFYRKLNFWPFSGRKMQKQQTDINGIFRPFRFPPQEIQGHLAMLSQLLNLAERMAGISIQDVGGYASHEQSAEEVRISHASTSQRSEYVGLWVDRAMEAMKSVIYSYLMSYGSSEAYAFIDKSYTEEYIRKAGFRVIDSGEEGNLVAAPLNNLRVESFIAQRDGPNRVPWTQIGQQMVQLVTGMVGAAPPEQIIPMINMALDAMQMPRDFRLKPVEAPPKEQPEDIKAWVVEQLKTFAGQAKEYVNSQQASLVEQLMQGLAARPPVAPAPMPLPPIPMPSPSPLQPPPPLPFPIPGPEPIPPGVLPEIPLGVS